jgi:ABC-type glycerol-3-phosphate transport system substrate-binding protein
MRAAIGESEPPPVDPVGARRVIWKGRAAMALTWPTGANVALTPLTGKPDEGEFRGPTPISIGVAELPGSRDVYNPASRTWETRADGDDGRVPVIGFAGRIGSVTKTTRNAPTAFQFLVWLCGSEMGAQIGAASPATTLFRHTQVTTPGPWVDPRTPAPVARDYARLVARTLARHSWLGAPRIPAADRYVAVLDQAVQHALADRQSPSDALQDAARRWQKITEQMGVEAQKEAYAQSLGLR